MSLSQKRKAKLVILTIVMAVIAIVYIYPVFLMFPMLQKYFVKGITVGGVKG